MDSDVVPGGPAMSRRNADWADLRPSAALPRPDPVMPATAQPVRVLIVDDHTVLSEALSIAIDAQSDLHAVGTSSSIAAGLSLAQRLAPDVILLDVMLPDGDGIEAIPRMLEASPSSRVLVLTGHTDVDQLSRAASQGASGFLPKESPVSAILGAIRAAISGQLLVDGATLAAILGRLSTASRRPVEEGDGQTSLTRRESDVLRLMGGGHDPHAIAKLLGISIHTCRGYQKSLMAKLGAHSQLEAVVIGTRKGLISR